MFMKIINKNASRDVFIVLAVSFVLCFSLLLFCTKGIQWGRFFKITNFTVFIMKFGFLFVFLKSDQVKHCFFSV